MLEIWRQKKLHSDYHHTMSNSSSSICTLLVSLAVALLLSASCGTLREPSSGNEILRSSTGAYEAFYQEVTHGDSLSRQLVVRRSGTHSVLLAYPIQRHAEIVWSPDDSAIAILDCLASNESQIAIFLLPSGNRLRGIGRDNISFEMGTKGPSAKEYSHVYFSAPQWITPLKLRTAVEMYDRLSM